MNKKIYILSGILLLNIQIIYSQFDLDIFKNYTPKWMYVTADSSGFNYPGYFEWNKLWYEKGVLKDNYFYSLYSYDLQAIESDGGLIEKLDLNTGKRIWQDVYDLRTIEINEYPNNMFINKNGNIEVLGLRAKHRDEKNGTTRFNKMVVRRYDNETGELKDYIYSEPDDTTTADLQLIDWRGLYQYYDSSYQYIRTLGGNNRFWDYKLNEKGEIQNYDSVFINDGYLYHEVFPMILINKDTLVTKFYSYNSLDILSDTFDFKYFIKLYDRDLNEINSFDVSNDLNAQKRFNVSHIYADEKYIILRFVNEPEFFDWHYYYLIYDYQGNFRDRINLLDLKIPVSLIVRISEDEFLMCGAEYLSGDFNSLYFYKKKIGEPAQLIKKIDLKKKDFVLSPVSIYVLDNNDILFNGYYRPVTLGFQGNQTYFPIKIRFSSEDIDITANKEISLTNPKDISISPNPAKSTISLDFAEIFSGDILITDVLGRVVINTKVINVLKQDTDVSALAPGMYLVKVIDKKNHNVYKVGRFVKE